jgi:hypothetical protein
MLVRKRCLIGEPEQPSKSLKVNSTGTLRAHAYETNGKTVTVSASLNDNLWTFLLTRGEAEQLHRDLNAFLSKTKVR